jgi:hypothetical protein
MVLPIPTQNKSTILNTTLVYTFSVLYDSSEPLALSFGASETEVVTYTLLTLKSVEYRAITYFKFISEDTS